MSVELIDAQFMKLLGVVDINRSFSSSVQGNAALAIAATKIRPNPGEPPFPTDFVLSPAQSTAIQLGVDVFMSASKSPGNVWIAKHALPWIQWLFVKSWFLISGWHASGDEAIINNYRSVLIFVLRVQVGTSGQERSYDRELLAALEDFVSGVMQPEMKAWPQVVEAYNRLKKSYTTFKEGVEEVYARVKSQEVSKFSQPITRKKVLLFLNECFKKDSVPTQVAVFINQLWFEALIRVRLKEGADSSQWEEMRTATESLSRIFNPRLRKKEDFANCNKLKPLCLEYGRAQDSDCLSKINDVQNLILGVLYGDPPPPGMQPLHLSVDDLWEVVNTPKNKLVLEKIKSLEPGHWVFIPGEESGSQLQQVLVLVEETGHFIFVNKAGLLYGVRSLSEMIDNISKQEMQIIGEELVFARHAKNLVTESFDKLIEDKLAKETKKRTQDVNREAPAREVPTRSQKPKPPEIKSNVEVESSGSSELKAARRLLSQLAVGDWVELRVDGKGMMRCKVSVRLPSVKRCSFVSALGMLVADMHEDDLAQFYVDGNLRLVKDNSPETLEELMSNRPVEDEESFGDSEGV